MAGTEMSQKAINQPLLPTIEANVADLYSMAVAQSLAEKIRQAIALLQMHEPPEGYYLAYSGGKDSGCILELAKMAGIKFRPYYNITTLDPPELVRFIKREHEEVVWDRPEKTLLTRMAETTNGPPTRIARWCCREFKERGGSGQFKILGVRAPESPRRKLTWKRLLLNRNGGHIICPILYWTEDDVWQFHQQHGLSYCRLYDRGFRRLGCVGCPLGGPKQQRRDFERWPGFEQAWRRAFHKFWNNWHGVPTRKGGRRWFEDFGDPDSLFEWWVSGRKKEEPREECQGLNLYS